MVFTFCDEVPTRNVKSTIESNMDEKSHTLESVGWNNLSIPKLKRLCRWSLRIDT